MQNTQCKVVHVHSWVRIPAELTVAIASSSVESMEVEGGFTVTVVVLEVKDVDADTANCVCVCVCACVFNETLILPILRGQQEKV